MSDDLIASLAADLKPVRPEALRNRLLLGLGAGMAAAALLMLFWLGLRADLAEAVTTPIFWLKFAFATTLTLAGLGAAIRLSRPGGSFRVPVRWATAIVAATGLAGLLEHLGNEALAAVFWSAGADAEIVVAAVDHDFSP